MDPRLSKVLELQRVLSVQRDTQLEYEKIPKRRDQILSYIQNLKEEANAAEERFIKHEIEQKNFELELQQGQETRVKKEAQLLSIKNNKEYQATLSEIETLDRKNSRAEEKLIELMDLVEKERKILAEKKQELKDKESGFQQELDELDKQEKASTAQLNEAKTKADEVGELVPPDLYQRFVRVFESKGGVAIATANGGHCGVCNIRLTPRLIQLTKRGQDIVFCEGCARFLYWDASLEEDRLDTL